MTPCCVPSGPAPQHEEPILIDDTTDEEADAQRPPSNTPEAGALDPGEAAGAAGAAGAGTRRRSARQGGGAGGGSAHFQTLSEKLAGLKCCYPPDGGKHSVEVTAEDLARLEPREFLNDTCIDFYIKWVGVRGTEGPERCGRALCTIGVAGTPGPTLCSGRSEHAARRLGRAGTCSVRCRGPATGLSDLG